MEEKGRGNIRDVNFGRLGGTRTIAEKEERERERRGQDLWKAGISCFLTQRRRGGEEGRREALATQDVLLYARSWEKREDLEGREKGDFFNGEEKEGNDLIIVVCCWQREEGGGGRKFWGR